MNKIFKKALFFLFFFGMNTLSLFANNEGRGRLDSGGPSDFSAVLLGIVAIVVGGFFALGLFSDNSGNSEGDKAGKQLGCAGIIAVIVGFVLLIGMGSH